MSNQELSKKQYEFAVSLKEKLSGWWPEYIGDDEGWECGCNADGYGHPDGLPTVTEVAEHMADHIVIHTNFGEMLAKAWDEGHKTRQIREPDSCMCFALSSSECGCGLYGSGRIITPNPYSESETLATELVPLDETITTVYGYSDDLIELDGQIYEEFPICDGRGLLVFDNEVTLLVEYDVDGVWRITDHSDFPSSDVEIVKCEARNDYEGQMGCVYSDLAKVTGATAALLKES